MDTPISTPTQASWKGLLALSKELLPWLMVILNFVYGFGVKQSTTDNQLRQQTEDHTQLQEVRTQLADLNQKQSGVAAKLDLLIAAEFRGRDAK
jgi:ABC-type taurine transport system ATPase subunit